MESEGGGREGEKRNENVHIDDATRVGREVGDQSLHEEKRGANVGVHHSRWKEPLGAANWRGFLSTHSSKKAGSKSTVLCKGGSTAALLMRMWISFTERP